MIKNRTPRDPLTPVEAERLRRSRRGLILAAIVGAIVLLARRHLRSA